MKVGLPLVLTGLAVVLAVGGCSKKEQPAAPAPREVVLTVTVTGEVDAEGKFKQGGYNVAAEKIDGGDVAGLAAAISAKKAEIEQAGAKMVLRVLVYPDTPYGVVRQLLPAAAKAGADRLSLACIASGSSAQPAGVRFNLPSGTAVPVRIWPGPLGVNLIYAVGDATEAVLGTNALRAVLSRHTSAGAACLQPTDKATAGLVADAIGVVREVGFENVCFAADPLRAPAPKLASAPPPAATQPTGPVVTGPKPPAGFVGAKGEAYHVIYLIDRSGSMLTTFETIRSELIKSIASLKPEQDFHVIFFGGRRAVEAPEKKLLLATAANKAAVSEFLKGIPSSGVTQPIPAIRRAFSVFRKADKRKPGKLIFMLTDGDFAGENRFTDNEAVLEALRMLNVDKDVSIHTLLFGKQSATGEKILQTIATEHNGKYRFIEAE